MSTGYINYQGRVYTTSFTGYQMAIEAWNSHNFPDKTKEQPLLGIVEELGEISHSYLKYIQKIRNYDRKKFEHDAPDAIGDLLIYLMDFCTQNGFPIEQCLEQAWNEIKDRDWQKFPGNGKTE